jgi:hypothetical protein
MHEGVALVDRVTNNFLKPFRLKPGFTVSEIILGFSWVVGYVIVSAHKGIERTELVELHREIIRGAAKKSGKVTASEYNSRNSKSQQLVDRHLHVFVIGQTVPSPHGGVSLGAEEVAAC